MLKLTPFGTRAYARVIVPPESEEDEVRFYPSLLPVRCRGEWRGMKIVRPPLVPHTGLVWNEAGELAGRARFLGGEKVYGEPDALSQHVSGSYLVSLPCYIPDGALQFVGDGYAVAAEIWIPQPKRADARSDDEHALMLQAYRSIRHGEYKRELVVVSVPLEVQRALAAKGTTLAELLELVPPEMLVDALQSAWERYQRKHELALELLGQGPG